MLLDDALELGREGYKVFPLNGRIPLRGSHGCRDATDNEDGIYFRWSDENLNIGIATGPASRCWVLDVDPRHGGDKSLAELEHKHKPLPRAREVRTGRGGRHLYFRLPSAQEIHNSTSAIAPGLDVRGDGGYVVAPHSIHDETKKPYTYIHRIEPAESPAWLLELILLAGKKTAAPGPQPNGAGESVPEGRRNAHLASLAGTLRRRGCTQAVILAALVAENAQKCKPPLSDREIANIAASVSRYEPQVPPPRPNGQPPPVTIEDVRPEPLIFVTTRDFVMREIKEREMLLDPILPEQGLIMLYSYRGIGKTFISIGIATAVAAGAPFLRWKAPRPRKVLYVDGEMPAKTLQERILHIVAGMEQEIPEDGLRWITPDFQNRAMPDLATAVGQNLLEPHLEGIDLVVLDNLSCLCRYGCENEGESWLPVQDWALKLRRRGMSVMFDHHSNRNFGQRGTSRREDLLDTVITLKHPDDYDYSEGLRCEVHFEKTRIKLGELAKAFEVRLTTEPDGRAVWTMADLEDRKAMAAAQLFADGASIRQVAEELGISKWQAAKLRKKWGSPE